MIKNKLNVSKTNKNDYEKFKKKIQKYSIEAVDENSIATLDMPFELKDRVGFPYRLDRSLNESSIMIMGINPAGNKVDDKDYICIIPDADKLPDNTYGYHKYYDANYDLVRDLDVKLFWSSYDLGKDLMDKNIVPKDKYDTEKNKKGMYLVFSNSIYIHETSSTRLQKVLINGNELNMKIKQLLEVQIEYYNPKYIIVTNAWVSKRIHDIYKINEDKTNIIIDGVHFIFSGFISSGRLDRYKDRKSVV